MFRKDLIIIGVMVNDEARFRHLTPGVVQNFIKAVDVYDLCLLCTKRSQIPIRKEKGATLAILVSGLNINGSTLPQLKKRNCYGGGLIESTSWLCRYNLVPKYTGNRLLEVMLQWLLFYLAQEVARSK